MPTMKFRSAFLLYSLFAFLSTAHAITVEPPGSDTCAIQAWVRAPDLDPGNVIPGQVRIQTKGPCNPISEYSLILRFKERIWVKIPKPGIILPEEPPRFNSKRGNRSITDQRVEWNSVLGGSFQSIWFSNNSSWEEYAEKMKDSTLWAIAEEERVAFETRYKLSDGPTSQSEIESTHDFVLLVPTTNYPPSSDHDAILPNIGVKAERENEHIYLYTVEVKFDNGTTVEVPAGHSSFNAVRPNFHNNNISEVVSFTANFMEMGQSGLDHPEGPLNVSFNVDVTLPHGRYLEQGSTLNLTFTSSGEPQGVPDADRANHTVVLMSPSVDLRFESHHRRVQMLFPDLSVPAEIRWSSSIRRQYSPTSNDSERSDKCGCSSFFLRDQVQKPDWNTTTSVSLNIPKSAFPSFDMYYQSIEAKISIRLNLRYVRNEDPLLADKDYPWSPTLRRLQASRYYKTFLKEIPVTVYPRTRKPDIQIIHYLSPDARQPVFVDPCTTSELSRLSVEERDLLAPRSKPIIHKGTDGDHKVVRWRYNPSHSLHYVGDTWQREVVDSGLKINPGENGRCTFLQHAQARAGFMA